MTANVYVRGIGKTPIKINCDYGLIDDGENCIKGKTCERKSCKDNDTGCLECTVNSEVNGKGKIVKRLQDRLRCAKGEELDNGLCFKRCKHGYVAKGNRCIKGLSNKKNDTKISIFIFLEKIITKIKDILNIQNLNNKNIQLIIGVILFIFLITYYS
jgi:hypothetical protein